MIPVKLVETIFHRSWALVIPVILVPLLAMGLTPPQRDYHSTAVVWVTTPVVDQRPAIGSYNPYLTAAQNQAQTMSDLLGTESFRAEVAVRAGLANGGPSSNEARRAAEFMRVAAYATGVNLLTISAVSGSAQDSRAIVQGVLDEYLERATVEIQRDATANQEYFTQQLAVAQQAFAEKNQALAEYLQSHPKAADPTNVASQDITYRTLLAQVQTQQDLITSLQNSLQSVQLRAAAAPQSQLAQFSVQDSPSLATGPLPISRTSKYGIPFAGMLLGLLIGVAYIYIAYRTDHTIRSGEDLATAGVSLLGSVPQLQAAPAWLRYTPVGWFISWRRRDFARHAAAAMVRRSSPEQITVEANS